MHNTKKIQIMSFLGGLYFYIPIFALYFGSHGVSISAVIFSQVLYSIFSFLGEIPTGILADRFGQKKSVMVGYFLEMVGVVLLLFFPTTLGLYLSYSLRGIAGSCISGSEEALGYESCMIEKVDYKKFAGNCNSLDLVGTTIATTIAGFVLQFLGANSYELLLSLTFISLLLVFVISISLESYTIDQTKEVLTPKKILQQAYKLIISNDTIRTLVWVSLLTLNGQYFLQAVYPLQFESVQLMPVWTGLALSIGGVINIVLSKYMYKLEKYLTYEKIILLVHLIIGVAYLMMSSGYGLLVLVGFVGAWGLFNSHSSVTSDYINQEIDSSIRSTAISSLSFIRTGGQIVARLILGWFVGMIGVSTTLTIQGIYLLIGIAVSYWLLVRCGCVHKIEHTLEK